MLGCSFELTALLRLFWTLDEVHINLWSLHRLVRYSVPPHLSPRTRASAVSPALCARLYPSAVNWLMCTRGTPHEL